MNKISDGSSYNADYNTIDLIALKPISYSLTPSLVMNQFSQKFMSIKPTASIMPHHTMPKLVSTRYYFISNNPKQ